MRSTVSCVVNRRPHSGQVRLRLIAAPSSVERLSMTRVSGWRQNGQCTLTPPRFQGSPQAWNPPRRTLAHAPRLLRGAFVKTQGVVNYIGVTTRCCGPTVEARDHERKLTDPVPPKSLISRGLSGAPRACRRSVSLLLVRVTYVTTVHMRRDARPAPYCPCCKGVTEPPG